jgi:hypothetical protein
MTYSIFYCRLTAAVGGWGWNLRQFAKRAQITFGAVAKGNHLRIACKADHGSNIPLGELNLEKNRMEANFKFCLLSAVSIPIKAYPTIPLSDQSNLVRRYL